MIGFRISVLPSSIQLNPVNFVPGATSLIFTYWLMTPRNCSISIGKFSFRSDIFAKAKRMISQASDISSSFFIIDEIGKLELRGQGLEPELKIMLHERTSNINTLIVVVRDYLLDDVIKRYNLSDAVVIHIENKEEILNFC